MASQLEAYLPLVKEYALGIYRHRWLAVVVAWTVCILGWLALATRPDIYTAQARVYMAARTSLAPILQGLALTPDLSSQMGQVRQSLLGGPQLERLAADAGMKPQGQTPEARAELLDEIRSRVTLSGSDLEGGTVYTIAYESSDRELSLKVVDLLMKNFVASSLGENRSTSETQQGFLREQIAEYEGRLRAAEARLADFKRRNVGQMPGAQGDYFSRLQEQMTAAEGLEAKLAQAMARKEELQRQLRGDVGTTVSTLVDPNSASISDRVADAEKRLEDLLLRFTERHPDVIALRETIAQLRNRGAEEAEALRRNAGALAAGGPGSAANPVVQRIQQTMNDNEVEIASLRTELQNRRQKIGELRMLVNTVPEVEAEYTRLNRDYDVTRSQYTTLVDRLEKANLGQQAESTESIRFEIVDPPSASFQPSKPRRPLITTAILVMGVGAGLAAALLAHLLKPVYFSARAVQFATSIPVLGSVGKSSAPEHALALVARTLPLIVAVITLLGCFAVSMKVGAIRIGS